MSALELQPGDVFEGYTVRRAIGRGGMGAVYLVYHPRFATDMALKVMTLVATTEEELQTHRARFTREARTLVRLRHQSIVRVHEFAEHVDEDGVCPYILMEYFPGVDGLKWIRTNPSMERIRHVAIQLADALANAHDNGVLHRDVKYGNILVDSKDLAVLIDFGIAKSETDDTVTQTGLSVGTLSHMAPEYLSAAMRGDNPSHTIKTDIWAFGCLLYFLSAHRNAFQSAGKGQVALLRALMEEPHTSLRSVRPDVSVEWAQLVDDLLTKDPEQRIRTAHEVAQRLKAMRSACDETAPAWTPPTPPGAIRTPTPGNSSVKTPSGASLLASAVTAHGRKVLPSDDPFAGAQPLAVEMSAAPAIPHDGISMLGQLSVVQPVQPREATPAPAPVVLAPPPPPAAVAAAGPAVVAIPAPANSALNTFIGSLQPEIPQARAAPVEHAPPDAPAAEVQDVQPALSSTPPDADASVVQPLPSFAPPTPKAVAKTSALRALAIPVTAVLAIAMSGLIGFSFLKSRSQKSAPKTSEVQAADDTLKRAEERSARELAALERAQVAPPAPTVPAIPAPVSAEAAAPAPVQAELKPAARRHAEAPTPVDPVAARFGNRNFNTSALGQSQPTATSPTPSAAGAVAGVKIPVRVDAEIASTQSPVVAVVTRETKVGALTLPVGTQVHGTSGLGASNRVTVQFRFAIVGGKNIPLQGVALGPDGRAGLPGQRTMGNGTDVAARAVGSAMSATAGIAAEVVGDNPLGAAVRSGGGTAAGKSERLNSDENVVLVKRGQRFTVYVGG